MIVAVTAVLIVGVAIPKLTVRSVITLSDADARCVQAGIKQQLNHPLERAALFLGKSAVVGTQDTLPNEGIPIQITNTFAVKSYTLFRIPLPVNEKPYSYALFVDCNVVPEQIDQIERLEVRLEILYEGDDIVVGNPDPLGRTFTKEHVYIKRYDYDNSTLWYVVNQRGQLPYMEPSGVAGTLVTELDDKTASIVSKSVFQNPPKDASLFLRVYDRKINIPTQALIALSSDGEVLGTQTTLINKNYYNKYDMGYISNSNRLYVACSSNGNLVVLDQDDEIINQSKEFRCSRSRAMRALSRDSATVFYTEGLYEAYGLGEVELRRVRNESKKLRAFSFTTGTSTVVAEEGGWLLSNSKNINTASGIYSQPIRKKASDNAEYTRGFIFYQLPMSAFDFLTYEEVAKLPEVNSFEIDEKWNIDETRFTPNGKTLVFGARSTAQGSARKEVFGFYDIYKNKLIFPISIEGENDSARLWQTSDKDNAFIITSRRGENREGIGGTTAMYIAELYHIRRDGTAIFIDSIPNLDGSIVLLGKG